MTILETQSQPWTQRSVRWTEVCAVEHAAVFSAADPPATLSASRRVASVTRPGGPRNGGNTCSSSPSTTPGHRASAAAVSQVRACRAPEPVVTPMVDDVPTWILLACGVVFAVLMLLALTLVGGPAYA